MEPGDLQEILLIVVGVLCFTALWVVPLLGMVVWMTRRSAADRAQVIASWQAIGRDFGLTLQKQASPFQMDGIYQDRPLEVYGNYGTRNSSGYTHIVAKLNFQADVYFRATKHPTMGVSYVPSGDAELDRVYHFLSRPPDLTRQLMRESSIRGLLNQADPLWITLTPREITISVKDVEKNQQRLRAMIELNREIADVVEIEIGRNIPQQSPQSAEAYRELGQTMPTIRLSRTTTWIVLGSIAVGFLCFLTIFLIAALAPVVQTLMESFS